VTMSFMVTSIFRGLERSLRFRRLYAGQPELTSMTG
jgi:hypothetical protein